MNINAASEAIAATLTGVGDLRRAYPRWTDKPEAPCVIVKPYRGPGRWTLRRDGGMRPVEFELTLLVSSRERHIDRAMEQLNKYLDPEDDWSVETALEGNKTLDGHCTTLSVAGWRDYGGIEVGDVTYVGVIIELEVFP